MTMRVRWFGYPWPDYDARAPICEDNAYAVETPGGELCLGCEEPIEEGDRGLMMAAGLDIPHSFFWSLALEPGAGMVRVRVCAMHIDCHLRSILGPGGERWVERRP